MIVDTTVLMTLDNDKLAVDTSPGQQAVRTSSRFPTLRRDHPPPNALIVPLGGQFPPT